MKTATKKRKTAGQQDGIVHPAYLVRLNNGVAVRHDGHKCCAKLIFDDRCESRSLRREIVEEICHNFQRGSDVRRRLTDDEVEHWGARYALTESLGQLRTMMEDARTL